MTNAQKICEYLEECGVFYIATIDGIWPRVRPETIVCVCGGVVHFLFGRGDDIYGQLLMNDRAAIAATHPDKSTILIEAKLREDNGEEPRQEMMKHCEESLDEIRKEGTLTVFRVASARAVITQVDGKTEEIIL